MLSPSWGGGSGFFPHDDSVWRWDSSGTLCITACKVVSKLGLSKGHAVFRQNSGPKFNSWELLVRFMTDPVQGPGTAAAWGGVAAKGGGQCSLVVLRGEGWLGTPGSMAPGLTRE